MIAIQPIAALDSNYFWLLYKPGSHRAIVVDPGASAPVLEVLAQQQLALDSIIITHRHYDHVDGIPGLQQVFPEVRLYGPHSKALPQITYPLVHGDTVSAAGMHFSVLAVPGHTEEHIAYVLDRPAQPAALFCGDALFAGGCGRRNEGSAAQMWQSLKRLSALADDTLMYCAHEYTQANLAFAWHIEGHSNPVNSALQERIAAVDAMRSQGQVTLPSSIREENRTNPFLRCHLPQVRARVEALFGQPLASPAEVFGAMRQLKDQWKGV